MIGKGFDPMVVVLHAEQGETFTGVGRVWDAAGFGGSSLCRGRETLLQKLQAHGCLRCGSA